MAVKQQDPLGDTSPTSPNPGSASANGGAGGSGGYGGGGAGAAPGGTDVTVPPAEQGGDQPLPPAGGQGQPEPQPDVPAPPPLPSIVAPPNTPTSLGTFALPGTAGSEAFRSPNFAMNRGLGKDIAGAMGRRKRFSEGVPVAAQTGALTASARRPEDWADSIAAYLAGR